MLTHRLVALLRYEASTLLFSLLLCSCREVESRSYFDRNRRNITSQEVPIHVALRTPSLSNAFKTFYPTLPYPTLATSQKAHSWDLTQARRLRSCTPTTSRPASPVGAARHSYQSCIYACVASIQGICSGTNGMGHTSHYARRYTYACMYACMYVHGSKLLCSPLRPL